MQKSDTPLPKSSDNRQGLENITTLFSSEKGRMDYVTLTGIRSRTGVEKDELPVFVLKELVDNALDSLEKHLQKVSDSLTPTLKVFITTEANRYIKFRVLNTNFGIAAFSERIIHSIFNFDNFYSSKRNLYKIGRGALGDALKEIVCVPYALADYYEIDGWNEPLIISSGNYRFTIHVLIDKIKQTVTSEIKVEEMTTTTEKNTTQVEVCIPTIEIEATNIVRSLELVLKEYALLNTHVSFHFELSRQQGDPKIFDFPQVPHVTPKWSNAASINYYTFSDFKRFILGLEDNNLSVYNIIQNFREGSNIKKEELSSITVGELKYDQDKLYELYLKLRKIMTPKSKIEVPFDIRSKKQSLKERIERFGYTIQDIDYRAKHGHYSQPEDGNSASVSVSNYKGSSKLEFPYLFEVAIIKTSDLPYNLLYVEGINSSPQHYHTFLIGPQNTFSWKSRNEKRNNARIIFEILEKYGYSYNGEKCKRPGSIVIVNLISPRIDYENYGKSRINLKPFADTIAETIYKTICSNSNSSKRGIFENDKPPTTKELLVELLEERKQSIEQDPTLKDKDKWTQSTVFYRLRPRLLDNGIEKFDRRYITSQIKNICEEDLRVKREEIGIVAADRAQLYFKGVWHDVGLDELDELKHMGTDLLIIEKEGVAEVLGPYADRKGVALLNTRGFLTEYATMLSRLSKENGCNVAILTDFDASGLLLAKKVPNIYRIGIDFETLDYFGIKHEQVQEDYEADNNHIKPLKQMAVDDEDSTLNQYLSFVNHKRIEIDSVLAKVGNKRFWDFVVHKLDEKFPTRNYNRSINVPHYIMPDKVQKLISLFEKTFTLAATSERARIMNELSHVSGFVDDIAEQEEKFEARLEDVIIGDKDTQTLLSKVEKLMVTEDIT